jgi:magnesium and cobalt exporter, CNNM family
VYYAVVHTYREDLMSGIVWRLLATIIFVFLNGFFVAAEFALVKVRPGRIAALARKGGRSAILVEKMLGRFDLCLSACQLGITLASLILGWLAEPAVAKLLIAGAEAVGIKSDPVVVHGVALAIALAVVTVLHMTVGEQAPKIWSIRRAESMALRIAYPLWLFTLVFRPLISVVNVISNLLLKGIGLHPGGHDEASLDVGEIKDLLVKSASEGHITSRQGQFATNVISIARLEVRHILVPRVDVVTLSVNNSVEQNLRLIQQSAHTRFPLCRNDLDSVIGILHSKAILGALLDKSEPDLESLANEPVFVPETHKVARMINVLQEAGRGCAVVVDEYGTAVGMAFLDDAIEEIVGPIRDEFDTTEEEYKEISPGVLEISGAMDLPATCDLLDVKECGDEDTIGGHIIAQIGRLPDVGDKVVVGNHTLEVTEVRRHCIRRVRATKKLK